MIKNDYIDVLIIGPHKERDKYTYNLVEMLKKEREVVVNPIYLLNILSLYKRIIKTFFLIRQSRILHLQHYASLARSHYAFTICIHPILLLSRLFHKKIVITMQSPVSITTVLRSSKSRVLSKMKANLWKSYMKSLGNLSDIIIVHTNTAKKLLEEEYNLKNVVYVPNWAYPPIKHVDRAMLKSFQQKYRIEDSDKILLLFGIPIEGKGYHFVIKALPKIIEKHQNVKLLIAGDVHSHSPNISVKKASKEYKAYLSSLIEELNLKQVVIMTGYVPNELIPIVMSIAHLIIFPYEYRPYASGAFSEALSSIRPLVVSKIPTFDMLKQGETCLKINIESTTIPDQIATAVNCLLDDHELYNKIKNNLYNMITIELSPKKFIARHIRIYKSVLQKKKDSMGYTNGKGGN